MPFISIVTPPETVISMSISLPAIAMKISLSAMVFPFKESSTFVPSAALFISSTAFSVVVVFVVVVEVSLSSVDVDGVGGV